MIPSKNSNGPDNPIKTHTKKRKNSHPKKNPKKHLFHEDPSSIHSSIHLSIHHPLEVGSEKESSISNQPKLPIKQQYPQALSHLQ